MPDLSAIALNCSLKRSNMGPSSTDAMIRLVTDALGERGVRYDGVVRVADHDLKPGVTSDEGEGDAWPALRTRVLATDILVLGTPIWLGQPSSIAKRVVERMDAFLSEGDDKGRFPSFGKVALVAVVGNEDGAHHVAAELYQALNDVGWTVPASAAAYWVGEAMGGTDFQDLPEAPENVRNAARLAASSAAHLAGLLKDRPYPGM